MSAVDQVAYALVAMTEFGLPIYILSWTVFSWRRGGRTFRKAATALFQWLAWSVIYLAGDLFIAPCWESCEAYRHGVNIVVLLAPCVIYTVGGAVIAVRLHRKERSGVDDAISQNMAQRGFTLLELLVVVAIIGLLAAYVGPKYFGQIGKSEQALAKAQIDSFNKALAAYRLDVGNFPTTEEGLSALIVKPASASDKWTGPYLSKGVPMDPWGHAYVYRTPGAKSEYDLLSYGKDGQPGGTGEATDIGND